MKLLVFWIYLDAGKFLKKRVGYKNVILMNLVCLRNCAIGLGGGKYLDPKKGWSYSADPLPALDTYTRHTVGARYLYALLGPRGLRILTPTVVWVELLAAPVAFMASYFGSSGTTKFAIAMICQLHIGIALSIRNAVLLSFVACVAWFIFLPIGWELEHHELTRRSPSGWKGRIGRFISIVLVGGMVGGNIWYETIGTGCSSGNLRQIWSTLLQNRWNVFIGAEEYVFHTCK